MTAMRSGAARSGAAKVQLSDTRGDSLEAGRARVRLKLGAIGYVNAQIGIDADLDISGAALDLYCECAVRYWETITGRKFTGEIERGEAKNLRVAGLAYVNARHGVDASVDVARAGLGMVCEAAIDFCERCQRR